MRDLQTSQMEGPVVVILLGMLEPYPDGTGAEIDLFPVTGMRFKASFGKGKPNAAI